MWLDRDGRFVMGEAGLHLLRAIERLGSLAAAVREIGWSYRHAWGYLRHAEDAVGGALTRARPGKGAARGTELTPAGRLLMERLGVLRQHADEALGPGGPSPREIAARGRRRR